MNLVLAQLNTVIIEHVGVFIVKACLQLLVSWLRLVYLFEKDFEEKYAG